MKKIFFAGLFLAALVGTSFASTQFDYTAADTDNIVSDTTFEYDLSVRPVDYLSIQAIYSTDAFDSILVSTSMVDATADTVVSSVTYPAGFALLYTSTSFLGGGLSNNTTYYAIPLAGNLLSLATSQANALLGTAFNITAATSGTFQLKPIDVQASSAYILRWQYSNDNSNWYNSSLSTITISGATTTTNYLWDFGFTTYKYIRCALTAGGFGALKLKLQSYGKQVAR